MKGCRGAWQYADEIGLHLTEITVQGEVTHREVQKLGQCPECGHLVALKGGRIVGHNGYTLPLTEGESRDNRAMDRTPLEALADGAQATDGDGPPKEDRGREPGEDSSAEAGAPYVSFPNVWLP